MFKRPPRAYDQNRERLNSTSRNRVATIQVEFLESRQLLAATRLIPAPGAFYEMTLDGPGTFLARSAGRGAVDLILLGTTEESSFSVERTRTFATFDGADLSLRRIIIPTGKLQGIIAPDTATLDGPISPIQTDLDQIMVAGIGSEAQLQVDGNLGSLTTNGDLRLGPAGVLFVSGDFVGPIEVGGSFIVDGGLFGVGRDLVGEFSVDGDAITDRGGLIYVARDLNGGFDVEGSLFLAGVGGFVAGRDLASVDVSGDLDLSAGGVLRVLGDLGSLEVDGIIRGDGIEDEDIRVDLTLGSLRVAGGGRTLPSIANLDLDAGKAITGLDIVHGIFESFITAGVLIDGGTPTLLQDANIGPDGPTTLRNSEIRAGVQIRNLTFGGDVISDRSITSGRPTRIVAGLERNGTQLSGARIDNFQITGALIDGVVAASVFPAGDGFLTYDAPGGFVVGGTVGEPIMFFNATAPPFDEDLDPTIDDLVLSGAINLDFVPPPLPPGSGADPSTPIPLPTESTVLGGVISTRLPFEDQFDYAGIYAADTRGIFIGSLPN